MGSGEREVIDSWYAEGGTAITIGKGNLKQDPYHRPLKAGKKITKGTELHLENYDATKLNTVVNQQLAIKDLHPPGPLL
jgi:seryl-tRNA(Sec) selenium transferase